MLKPIITSFLVWSSGMGGKCHCSSSSIFVDMLRGSTSEVNAQYAEQVVIGACQGLQDVTADV